MSILDKHLKQYDESQEQKNEPSFREKARIAGVVTKNRAVQDIKKELQDRERGKEVLTEIVSAAYKDFEAKRREKSVNQEPPPSPVVSMERSDAPVLPHAENVESKRPKYNPMPFPEGEPGDLLYYKDEEEEWIKLENPGTPVTHDFVLRHDGEKPYWEEPGCD